MLVCGLRMLFGTAGVLPALAVVALAMMLGGGSMFLGSIFMMFGSLVMFVFGHEVLVGCQLPVSTNPPHTPTFQTIRSSSNAQGTARMNRQHLCRSLRLSDDAQRSSSLALGRYTSPRKGSRNDAWQIKERARLSRLESGKVGFFHEPW